MDKLFSQWDTDKTPGAVIAIVRDGKVLYEKGYGMANLELNIPLTPEAVLRTGSVSKQFTAACVAKLVLQKKIDLDDAIIKYFPELPKAVYGDVLVRHLVHHTSGVRDYLRLAYLAGFSDFAYYTAEEALGKLVKQKSLNFKPGDEFLYSNSGYMLMALLVERVSGKTLNEFAREHFFDPIGMKSTQFYEDHTRIVRNRADGYAPTPTGYRIHMTTLDIIGDGGVLTTVKDMVLWMEALQGRGPLDRELLEMMTTTEPLNNGEENDYAFGLGVMTYRGKKMISHGGAFVG
ncbi:MAG: beta-lactamase family protein, partial [Chlorobiales bacterium]|nr:beta-lactamase family protein [Chlorobiales bacterium]